ncbi:radical SAM protein [Paenibacillus sp. FSL F4-0122]|uniref:radical SAM/SPASM domain-containing protein n=1 Tax=unclassified Paenibacillus TaxID=185978 RepID=UPI0030F5F5AF
MGSWLIRNCKESGYILGFDKEEGTFIRYGKEGSDPFYNKVGPELLDIAITNYCERGCYFCYRASNRHGYSMRLEDYELVMEQAEKSGVLQVALGGGNPNQHPQFIQILQKTREHNIVPSYTTNGQGMTDEIYEATKKFCGAMAVSWYKPYVDALNVIKRAGEYGIKVNIHFMLNKRSLLQAMELMEEQSNQLEGVNAIVFLNYKPVHSSDELCLTDGNEIKDFFEFLKKFKKCKIGFDSCMISYLPLMGESLLKETVDFCEAARFSGYISENLLFYPCSFMNDISGNGIDLRKHSLQDGWRFGEEFIKMRERLSKPSVQEQSISKCRNCESYEMCHGGCQIFNINRCR